MTKEKQIKKQRAKVIGANNNVFNLLSICKDALEKAGLNDKATELAEKVMDSGSYKEAIVIMSKYCELC